MTAKSRQNPNLEIVCQSANWRFCLNSPLLSANDLISSARISSTIGYNGWGYVACPVGSGRFPYPPDKFTLKQDKFLIDQPWGMRCTLCYQQFFFLLKHNSKTYSATIVNGEETRLANLRGS